MNSETHDTERFKEDEFWSLGATDMAVDAPNRPYLQFNCPNCDTPNCFEFGLNKRDMPVDCVECGEPMCLRVSIRSVDAESDHS